MHRDHEAVLRGIYGGRRWILATEVLAVAPDRLDELHRLGADDVLVIAGSRGVGDVPDDFDAIVLGVTGEGIMEAIKAFDAALGDVGPGMAAAVARFDPDRRAAVIGSTLSQRSMAVGRHLWGGRPARWRALEDKTVVDAIWQAAGVPQAPSVVVPAEPERLRGAAAALDAGRGTVWVADNRRGWHGGATGLRWAYGEDQMADAVAFMLDRADQVRVMPFLDGIACSIHGIVLPDEVITLRPCEMIVLRRPGRSDLCYAGMASTWDPAAADREEMRRHARRVGAHLQSTLGYRGGFTIDGIMTADGFRPTELNPRFSAGLGMLASTTDLPLELVHLAIVEGVDVDWDAAAAALERDLVAAADASRAVRCHVFVDRDLSTATVTLQHADGGLSETADGAADVTVRTGRAAFGGMIRVELGSGVVPAGAAVGAYAAAALEWADGHWELGLGPLEAAGDVRGATIDP